MKCKFCKNEDVKKAGIQIQSGKKVQRYQCKTCGRIFLGDEVTK